jgi:SAM-dependent methyltransferase
VAADPAKTPPVSAAAELARLYDLDLADEQADVELYLALARSVDGPILELASGSGRISLPLAAAGHAVTGVDRDGEMLERARLAWATSGADLVGGSLDLVEADLLGVELGARFELVILGLNGLLMLPGREAQLAALRAMRRHLAPGGRAVVDVWLPGPDDLAAYDGRVELAWVRSDLETGDEVAKHWSARYAATTGVARIDTFFDVWPASGGSLRRVHRSDELYLLNATEVLDLHARAGLSPVSVAGDLDMGPLAADSTRVVVVSGLL